MAWEPAGEDGRPETCSQCGQRTEWLMTQDCRESDGEEREYMDAERCVPCGWILPFMDNMEDGIGVHLDD